MTTRSAPSWTFTPQEIATFFFEELGYTDREIALLVSAHAGHHVAKRTIVGIRTGEAHYSGRNLAPAFASLASAWNVG
jgi:hypothetical protein